MISYNERLFLGHIPNNISTKELRETTDRAIVEAFCEATGLVIFDDFFIDVPVDDRNYRAEGFGHVITVGYENESRPLIWFGVSPCWNSNLNSIYSRYRFEYGVVACVDDTEEGYIYTAPTHRTYDSNNTNNEWFADSYSYYGTDTAYEKLSHLQYYNNSNGFDIYLTYCIADNGTIVFALHKGTSPIKNCNANSFIAIAPITNGTDRRHIALQPRMTGNIFYYAIQFGGAEDLGLISIPNSDKLYFNRAIVFPTMISTAYSMNATSTIERSCISKLGDGMMVTHRIYMPYGSTALDWYIPEGIFYEALNLNGMPSIGAITQYGNKRLMAFNYLASGGFRFCFNVDAVN